MEISFALHFNGQPISCGSDVDGVRLTDLRFYIHDLEFLKNDDSAEAVTLTEDGKWQSRNVVLIDLENAEGACLNGSADTNHVARGRYSGESVKGLVFRLGVPQALNHQDPLQAGAPLAYSEMHWYWASGYKFMRAGVETDDDSFFLHLGSSRCEGTIGNIRGCRSSNRPLVSLVSFNPGKHSVVIELDQLFSSADLHDNVPSECMSGPADGGCRGPFAQLGIDPDSGATVAPATVFRVGERE